MRFISRNSNLRIILKPGLPASPLTGTMAIPTVFVKFQDGEAYVENEDLIMAMKSHLGFNVDFIAVEEGVKDPFAHTRTDIEPGHQITEMKYGHAAGTKSSAKRVSYTPEMQAAIQAEAMKLVKEMLPGAVASVLGQAKKNIAEDETAKAEYEEEAAEFPVVTGYEVAAGEDVNIPSKIIEPKVTKGRKAKK